MVDCSIDEVIFTGFYSATMLFRRSVQWTKHHQRNLCVYELNLTAIHLFAQSLSS